MKEIADPKVTAEYLGQSKVSWEKATFPLKTFKSPRSKSFLSRLSSRRFWVLLGHSELSYAQTLMLKWKQYEKNIYKKIRFYSEHMFFNDN